MSLPTTFFIGRGGLIKLTVQATFSNTATGRQGSIQTYTIPTTGNYYFVAKGASGGNTTNQTGGRGREITSIPTLFTAGTQLKILVGQAGVFSAGLEGTYNAGGGGGTFVWNASNNTLYVAAGGGGGASSVDYSYKDAPDSINGNDGFRALTEYPTSQGGANGQGGHHGDGDNRGGGGAGWLSDGQGNDNHTPNAERTAYRPLGQNPGRGGRGGTDAIFTGSDGGFGGGGGGGKHNISAYGGGGGGYSGGGGGSWDSSASGPGGGGGSYASAGIDSSVLHTQLHGLVEVYG